MTRFPAVLALAGLCAALPLAPHVTERTPPVQAAEPLEVAVENDAGPWSLRDGTGFANDVVRAAFKASGIEIRLRVVPYARCKLMAVEGLAVACFSMSRRPELTPTIAFPDSPLFVCQADYFQSTARPLGAASADKLPKGTVVGVVLGYEYPESLYRLQKDGIIVLDEAASEEVNMKKLADGRIAATVVTINQYKTADYLIAQAGVKGKVALAFHAGILPSFIGFSRKHPRGAASLAQFNAGLRKIAADGTMGRIEKAWVEKSRAATEALKKAGDARGGTR
ncbi:MAG: substrate-binding periplasmic protein [Gemmatimonadales bacterium]